MIKDKKGLNVSWNKHIDRWIDIQIDGQIDRV